jgi:hypothetical protein
MKLMPVFIDFESFWSTDHTLSKMTPTEYVMSPKTEIISMAIKHAQYPTDVWFGEDKIRHVLSKLDWSDKMVIGHNMSGFDALILKWRFGVSPAMWGCTAAMARSRYAKTCGVSLAKLVEELGVGKKDNTALLNTKGRYLKDFSPAEIGAMREYNKADTEQCAALFKALSAGFPKSELIQIHLTTEMLVNPQFELDTAMVETALSVERSNKHKALLELAKLLRVDAESPGDMDWSDEDEVAEFVRSEMASAARFAKLLGSCGVEVPMKVSPTNPDKMTPALAKTDEPFLKLQDHPSELVALAARTRLSVKSTLLETRLEAFLKAAGACGGKLPVPLKYAGADTTGRWSGEQYNMQNLPRINPSKPKTSDALRNSLKAPKGHKIIVADLSGIELRVNHFLWKVPSSMALFNADPEKADLYKDFASSLYNVGVNEVDKGQRQVGKVAHLGLGFGAGPTTFQKVAKLMAGIELSDGECVNVVGKWREEYAPIVAGWKEFQRALTDISCGNKRPIDPWGMCVTEHQAVLLPSGRRIHYPALHKELDDSNRTEWWYGIGRHRARIYAGKGVENLVQALARDVMADIAARLYRKYKYVPALLVHDEYVIVRPSAEADDVLAAINEEMRTPPKWWPELVLWSEGDVGDSYGSCK